MNDPRPTINSVHTVRERGIAYAAQMAIAYLFENAGTAALDIDSIRLRLSPASDPDHEDTLMYAKARVGAPPCPECHQPGDRPHTDYCPTRCTCPPEALVLGSHQPRCPVRAADPWGEDVRAWADGPHPGDDPWHAPLSGIEVRNPDGSTRPATRDDTLDLLGVPSCTCPPAQTWGSGGDLIDQSEAPDCRRHGEPASAPTPLHQCTDPTCPVTNPHHHAGTDVITHEHTPGRCTCGQDYDQPPTPGCESPRHHDYPRAGSWPTPQ